MIAYGMTLCLCLLSPHGFIAPDGGMTDQQLIQAMDALQAPLKDLYCEYEGWRAFPRKSDQTMLGLDSRGLRDDYSGTFLYKFRDHFIVDIFHRIAPDKRSRGSFYRETIASDGERTELYSRSDPSIGGAVTRHSTGGDLDVTGSYGRIFLARSLREWLRYEKKTLFYEGREEIDGRPCERYALVFGPEPRVVDNPESLVTRYWIDLARSAHVVQKEVYVRTLLQLRTSDIAFESLAIGPDHVWIPVSGKYEGFRDGELVELETYKIIRHSVRVNRGVDKARFSVKYPIGTPITDRLRGAVYEFGQDRRPPPETVAEAQARLEAALREAEKGRGELVAASWSRGGRTEWEFWIPLIVALAAVTVLAGLLIVRKKRSYES